MSHCYPKLTRTDRAQRRARLVAAYSRHEGCSRTLAARFGFASDGYVRQVLRDAGIARPPGRPT